jgi:hypothetical protein
MPRAADSATQSYDMTSHLQHPLHYRCCGLRIPSDPKEQLALKSSAKAWQMQQLHDLVKLALAPSAKPLPRLSRTLQEKDALLRWVGFQRSASVVQNQPENPQRACEEGDELDVVQNSKIARMPACNRC